MLLHQLSHESDYASGKKGFITISEPPQSYNLFVINKFYQESETYRVGHGGYFKCVINAKLPYNPICPSSSVGLS